MFIELSRKKLRGYLQGEAFDDLKLPGSIKEKQFMMQSDITASLGLN